MGSALAALLKGLATLLRIVRIKPGPDVPREPPPVYIGPQPPEDLKQ